MSKAILFLNGNINVDFCQNHIQKLNDDCDIYCTDGAYLKVKNSDYIVSELQKVIGDFDSLDYVDNELFLVNKDQYSTDFEKALEYLLQLNVTDVIVYGASGGEMDHFLSNMSIAKSYSKKINLKFIDEHSEYFFIPNIYQTQNIQNKMISVMPFPFATNVYYKGLEYILTGQDLALGESTGARNSAKEDSIEIKYDKGSILLFISHKNYK